MQWDFYFILLLFHFYVSVNSDSCACDVMNLFMLKLYWKVYFQCDMSSKPWNWYCARLWGVVSTRAMGCCQHQGYGELSVTGLWGVDSKRATAERGSLYITLCGQLNIYTSDQNSRWCNNYMCKICKGSLFLEIFLVVVFQHPLFGIGHLQNKICFCLNFLFVFMQQFLCFHVNEPVTRPLHFFLLIFGWPLRRGFSVHYRLKVDGEGR